MRRKKIIITIISFVLIFVAVIGIYVLHANKVETVYMSASWSYRYADLAEITSSSDAIAVIRVNKLISTKGRTLPSSIFEVKVIEPIYGCEEGELMNVYMTGGQIGNKKFEIKDDPLLKKGQDFLVFIRKNTDGTYTILGGPQGRLSYKKGKLNSLHNLDGGNGSIARDNSSVGINIENAHAEVLIDIIKSYLD